MPAEVHPPPPADHVDLKARDGVGLLVTAGLVGATVLGLRLSSGPAGVAWAAGQLVLALAFVQWFVVLHECGHGILFRDRRLNNLVGHVASIFTLIPYLGWKGVHGKHHKWTGWQDLDPTTVTLVPRPLGALEGAVLDVSWRLWIPLFSVVYRLNNFWNLPRLRRIFDDPGQRRRLTVNAAALLGLYLLLLDVVGAGALFHLVGAALLASLVFADPFMLLSQHTHMPMNLSQGEAVPAFAALDQEVFTRSLRFPPWFSTVVLLNFDAHELHHMYPSVPGYYLRRIAYSPRNEMDWWRWVRSAKRLPGRVFLFQNRAQSGATEV